MQHLRHWILPDLTIECKPFFWNNFGKLTWLYSHTPSGCKYYPNWVRIADTDG
jgi:hypothetical protein